MLKELKKTNELLTKIVNLLEKNDNAVDEEGEYDYY